MAHRLMFSNPPGDPAAFARAAQRSQATFLAIVADLVGEQDAKRYGALLISSANGIAGTEAGNQLADGKWSVTAEELIDTLVDMISATSRRR